MSYKICKHPARHTYRGFEFYHRTERSILRVELDFSIAQPQYSSFTAFFPPSPDGIETFPVENV